MKEMTLGDRMKLYENLNKQYLSPNQYVIMRLDGRSFSNFTKKFYNKPFDDYFKELMECTMEYLVKNISGCVCGYTQSDEITLLLTDKKSKGMEGWFDYRFDKMCSISAGMASAFFNVNFKNYLDVVLKYVGEYPYPVFDCRIWQVPNDDEVCNVFLWRQRDCIRNSILQYAQSFFSHNEMMNKNVDALIDMIADKGGNWNDLSDSIKYGTFYFPKGKDIPLNEQYFYCKMDNEKLKNEFNRIFNDIYQFK